MNTPNKLTISRIILVPIIVIVSMINIPGELFGLIPVKYFIIDILFIIGAITDKIDGKLARKNNQITTFGKFLDPIADKILVISVMILLVEERKLPALIPIITIIREFVISGYRLVAVEKNGNVIAANQWGKIKTTTQMIAIIIALLDPNSFGAIFYRQLNGWEFAINLLSTFFMTICTLATVFSGYEYLKGSKDILFDEDKKVKTKSKTKTTTKKKNTKQKKS